MDTGPMDIAGLLYWFWPLIPLLPGNQRAWRTAFLLITHDLETPERTFLHVTPLVEMPSTHLWVASSSLWLPPVYGTHLQGYDALFLFGTFPAITRSGFVLFCLVIGVWFLLLRTIVWFCCFSISKIVLPIALEGFGWGCLSCIVALSYAEFDFYCDALVFF